MSIITEINKVIRDFERARRHARRQTKEEESLKKLVDHEMKSFRLLWSKFDACPKKKICYFSSFDADGMVDDYVFFHLKALKEMGIDIIFISTSPCIDAQYVEILKDQVVAIIHRNNVGYDFFSWKIGMHVFPFEETTEQVFLVNDSVYGPLFSLSTVLHKMAERNLDVWGITDSWAMSYHVQSYFVCINLSPSKALLLNNFFENVKIIHNKVKLILQYEMGLTKFFLSRGFKVGALCDFREVYTQFYSAKIRKYRLNHFIHATNPTVTFWKELIINRLSPYLKTSILRDNYLIEVDPRNLEKIFDNIKSDLKLDIIIDHQKRISKGNFP